MLAMVNVGQRVSFIPHYMKEDKQNKNHALRPQPVEGEVFKINERGGHLCGVYREWCDSADSLPAC